VLTGYNFLEMNILHGLSKYFGVDPWWMYITTAFAAIFILMVPLAYYSIPRHFKVQWSKGNSPYMVYYTVFYIIFFSAIPHKEIRFLLPIVPFVIIMIAETLQQNLKNHPWKVAFWVKLYILEEIAVFIIYTVIQERVWEVRYDLAQIEPPIHSLWLNDRYSTPHFSMMHRQGELVKIYHADKDPQFARERFGHALPVAYEMDLSLCVELLGALQTGAARPEYITISESNCVSISGTTCQDICQNGITEIQGDQGTPLYHLEKVYPGLSLAWLDNLALEKTLIDKRPVLYKLNDDYTPY